MENILVIRRHHLPKIDYRFKQGPRKEDGSCSKGPKDGPSPGVARRRDAKPFPGRDIAILVAVAQKVQDGQRGEEAHQRDDLHAAKDLHLIQRENAWMENIAVEYTRE